MQLRILAAVAALHLIPAAALAHDGIHVENAYARVNPSGSGAVFMEIVNHSDQPDRLISAASDVAERVELHTHVQDAQGVMRMIEVKDGIPVAGGETRLLERGGDHVMLMGLKRPLKDGDTIALTLTFERGDVVTLEVPVDNARAPAGHGGHMQGGHMQGGHGQGGHGQGGHGHGHGSPGN